MEGVNVKEIGLMEKGGKFQLVTATDAHEEANVSTGVLIEPDEVMTEREEKYISADTEEVQSGGSAASVEEKSGSSATNVDKAPSVGSTANVEKSGSTTETVDKMPSGGTPVRVEKSGIIAETVDKIPSGASIEKSGNASAAVDKTPSGESSAGRLKSSSSTSADSASKAVQMLSVADKSGEPTNTTRKSLTGGSSANSASDAMSESGISSMKLKPNGRRTPTSDEEKSQSSLNKEALVTNTQAKAQSSVSLSAGVAGSQSESSKRQPQEAVKTDAFVNGKKAAKAPWEKAKPDMTEHKLWQESEEKKMSNKAAYDAWLTRKNMDMSDKHRKIKSHETLTVEEQELKKKRCKQVYKAWIDSKNKAMRENKLKVPKSTISTSKDVEARNLAAFKTWMKKKCEQRQRESELLAKELKEEAAAAKKVNTPLSKEAFRR